MHKRLSAGLIAAGLIAASVPAVATITATAAPGSKGNSSPACSSRTNNTVAKLTQCVTLDGVRGHQAAFQAIADANGGIRAAGYPGYDASVDYVKSTLEAAGYTVELDPFDFTFQAPAVLRQTAPVVADYETGAGQGSGAATFEGNVVPVDLALGSVEWPTAPTASTSGCEASDFDPADFTGPADIALIQRGACFFSVKAVNAEDAGAEAVVIFNQGNTPEREGLIIPTVSDLPDGTPTDLGIPVVGTAFANGVALSQDGSTAFIDVQPAETRTNHNVIAELPGKKAGNVVMAGAHLDSVQQGPGINDNGSGSAAILETAVQMAKVKPRNTVRFAWWGAEELGLIGSEEYVAELTEAERKEIALYLNFDMVGSPNHVFFVYDGDDSDATGAPAGPPGSAEIEKFFERFYASRKLPFKGTDFSGRSDYGPFIEIGIPAGGLFTGAEGIKTEEEAAIWGGTAGDQYDPCYHLACDTFDNNSNIALDNNSDAVAAAVLTYGMNTESINSKRGKGNFKVKPHTHGHKK